MAVEVSQAQQEQLSAEALGNLKNEFGELAAQNISRIRALVAGFLSADVQPKRIPGAVINRLRPLFAAIMIRKKCEQRDVGNGDLRIDEVPRDMRPPRLPVGLFERRSFDDSEED